MAYEVGSGQSGPNAYQVHNHKGGANSAAGVASIANPSSEPYDAACCRAGIDTKGHAAPVPNYSVPGGTMQPTPTNPPMNNAYNGVNIHSNVRDANNTLERAVNSLGHILGMVDQSTCEDAVPTCNPFTDCLSGQACRVSSQANKLEELVDQLATYFQDQTF